MTSVLTKYKLHSTGAELEHHLINLLRTLHKKKKRVLKRATSTTTKLKKL